MDNAPYKAELLPLLEAVKPHLGEKSQGVIEAALEMAKLFKSQSTQDIVKRFYRIYPEVNKGGKAVTLNTQSGRLEFSSVSFILLLLLALFLVFDLN